MSLTGTLDIWQTLSGLYGFLFFDPQGCRCAPTAGLKLANVFGVILFRGLSLRANPGLKLANACGVIQFRGLSLRSNRWVEISERLRRNSIPRVVATLQPLG